jgi:hypothetical protein
MRSPGRGRRRAGAGLGRSAARSGVAGALCGADGLAAAGALGGALHRDQPLDQSVRGRARHAGRQSRLAEQLGGEAITVPGRETSRGARPLCGLQQRHPHRHRRAEKPAWREWFSPSVRQPADPQSRRYQRSCHLRRRDAGNLAARREDGYGQRPPSRSAPICWRHSMWRSRLPRHRARSGARRAQSGAGLPDGGADLGCAARAAAGAVFLRCLAPLPSTSSSCRRATR